MKTDTFGPMRIAALLAICASLGSCTSQRQRYARDFVRSDARSDAANVAAELCGGDAERIKGRIGLHVRDYRCVRTVTPEVERWLSSYMEVTIMTLKTRNVRQVGAATCGEATFELNGFENPYRPFVYVPNGESIFAFGDSVVLADAAQCSVMDEIRSICAATAAEREKAQLRFTRCQARTPI